MLPDRCFFGLVHVRGGAIVVSSLVIAVGALGLLGRPWEGNAAFVVPIFWTAILCGSLAVTGSAHANYRLYIPFLVANALLFMAIASIGTIYGHHADFTRLMNYGRRVDYDPTEYAFAVFHYRILSQVLVTLTLQIYGHTVVYAAYKWAKAAAVEEGNDAVGETPQCFFGTMHVKSGALLIAIWSLVGGLMAGLAAWTGMTESDMGGTRGVRTSVVVVACAVMAIVANGTGEHKLFVSYLAGIAATFVYTILLGGMTLAAVSTNASHSSSPLFADELAVASVFFFALFVLGEFFSIVHDAYKVVKEENHAKKAESTLPSTGPSSKLNLASRGIATAVHNPIYHDDKDHD